MPILFKIAHSAPAYASTLQKILHRNNDNLPTQITTPTHLTLSDYLREEASPPLVSRAIDTTPTLTQVAGAQHFRRIQAHACIGLTRPSVAG